MMGLRGRSGNWRLCVRQAYYSAVSKQIAAGPPAGRSQRRRDLREQDPRRRCRQAVRLLGRPRPRRDRLRVHDLARGEGVGSRVARSRDDVGPVRVARLRRRARRGRGRVGGRLPANRSPERAGRGLRDRCRCDDCADPAARDRGLPERAIASGRRAATREPGGPRRSPARRLRAALARSARARVPRDRVGRPGRVPRPAHRASGLDPARRELRAVAVCAPRPLDPCRERLSPSQRRHRRRDRVDAGPGRWVVRKGGHRFVAMDVLTSVGERPVTSVRHTAIYEPRQVRDQS